MMKSMIRVIFLVMGVCIFCTDAACDPGWYGSNCQFQCHCSNTVCNSIGECQAGFKCARGWFGPGCQYQDLALVGTVTNVPPADQSLITDGDDSSCVQNINSIILEFDRSYPVTWIRISGHNLGRNIFLRFKDNHDDTQFSRECGRIDIYVSKDLTSADLFCYTNVIAKVIQLSLGQFSNVCSLHISGGRNLALKQHAIQSSTYVDTQTHTSASAANAVDGNTNTTFDSSSCAHTSDVHAEPYWTLQFPKNVHVNMINIYNRYDAAGKHCCPLRLNGFRLQLLNSTDQKVFEYNDKTTTIQSQYTIIDPSLNVDAEALKVSVVNSDHVLALCEIQVFGYDVCPPVSYGPECSRVCQCTGPDEICNMQSGTCVSGTVTNSQNISGCSTGWFGTNCQFKCHCDNKRCDNEGNCISPSACERGWFGTGCQYLDISVLGNVSTSPNHDVSRLLDGNDLTCVRPVNSVTIQFANPYPVFWLQIAGNSIGRSIKKTVQLKNRKTDHAFITTFDSMQVIDADDNKRSDIFIQTSVTAEVVLVTFESPVEVCSLHISGGRNLALKQGATQSSTYVEKGVYFEAGLAVNGDTSADFSRHSCAHTEGAIPEPYWDVRFSYPAYVKRVVLYNRHDAGTGCCPFRLNGFKLQLFNSSQHVYNYTDTTTSTTNIVYTVDPQLHVTSTDLKISVINRDHVLALCEVEVYGYDACPPGLYGPSCSRRCQCNNCNIQSGTCEIGSVPTAVTVTGETTCSDGWFGSLCQFMCHCRNSQCDGNGRCHERIKCASGWFGPGCQYQDLSVKANITINPPNDEGPLVDNDDNTCVRKINSVTALFTTQYPVSWIRVVGPYLGQNTSSLGNVTLRFKQADNDYGVRRSCSLVRQYASNDNAIVDLLCDTSEIADAIRLSWDGPIEICTLYISGGRNVALHQPASQSSTYSDGNTKGVASNAVDGYTDTAFSSGRCAHTQNVQQVPNWNVTFANTVRVNRIVIYNRYDVGKVPPCCPDRLRGFRLALLTSDHQQVYTFVEGNNTAQIIYNVVDPALSVDAQVLQISVTNSEKVLALCEVEVYGYDVCPPGLYGPECSRRCHCADVNEVCQVQSGACLSGCANHYRGDSCDLDCSPGTKEIECYPPCSDNCYDSACDRISGLCLKGCIDQNSQSRECMGVCGANLFGSSCQFTCHCSNNDCNISGACHDGSTCASGWFGPSCQYQDLATTAHVITSPQHIRADVIDGDDATCQLDLNNIQVNFTRPFVFTWMRLVVLEYDKNTRVTLQFRDSETGATLDCLNMKEYVLDSRTTDIYCDLTSSVINVNITFNGSRSVCSLHVSGGRNIALNLMQQTSQSSTYSGSSYHNVISANAVDGDTTMDGDRCARTATQDTSPYWLLTFPRQYVVSRCVVYNGIGATGTRQGYTLYAKNSHNVKIFNHSVINDGSGISVVPMANVRDLIASVRIEPTPGSLLTLCELEVYGEVVCPDGWFGPECNRKCNCANISETCLVSSGGCPSGCAAGYKGGDCSQRMF